MTLYCVSFIKKTKSQKITRSHEPDCVKHIKLCVSQRRCEAMLDWAESSSHLTTIQWDWNVWIKYFICSDTENVLPVRFWQMRWFWFKGSFLTSCSFMWRRHLEVLNFSFCHWAHGRTSKSQTEDNNNLSRPHHRIQIQIQHQHLDPDSEDQQC